MQRIAFPQPVTSPDPAALDDAATRGLQRSLVLANALVATMNDWIDAQPAATMGDLRMAVFMVTNIVRDPEAVH